MSEIHSIMIISETPGKLTCPYCGGEKFVMAISSGNTIRGEVWSDTRHYYPMLPHYSTIQQCPTCARYFYFQDGNFEMTKTVAVNGIQVPVEWPSFRWRWRGEEDPEKRPEMMATKAIRDKIHEQVLKNRFGDLTYAELADARKDVLTGDVSDERKEEYLLLYLYAYNDAKVGRVRSEKENIPEEYNELFRKCASYLIDMFGEKRAITAELWRELGEFDKCIEICENLLAEGIEGGIVKQILEHARIRDIDPFLLVFDEA